MKNDKKWKEFVENVEAMQPTDVLSWDVHNMRVASRCIHDIASARKWVVRMHFIPPLKAKYTVQSGRVMLVRFE